MTSEVLSDDATVSSVTQQSDSNNSSSYTECVDDMDTDESHGVVSATDAQEAVLTIRRYFEQQNGADFDPIFQLDNAVKDFAISELKQRKITDYF